MYYFINMMQVAKKTCFILLKNYGLLCYSNSSAASYNFQNGIMTSRVWFNTGSIISSFTFEITLTSFVFLDKHVHVAEITMFIFSF